MKKDKTNKVIKIFSSKLAKDKKKEMQDYLNKIRASQGLPLI